MREVQATASGVIDAPPSLVYSILADYRAGHPSILPRRAFLSLDVEEGGVGAGTTIRFRMKAFGATREARARITEPTPGRVLVETDVASGFQTKYEVRPVEGSGGARVTILTRWNPRGIRGWIESLFAPGFLRKVYEEELENLARRVEGPLRGERPA